MLPLVGELFWLQQMRENAPADFRIPLPLSITESTAGCWGKQGLHFQQRPGCSAPPRGFPKFPAHPITTSRGINPDRRQTQNSWKSKGMCYVSPLCTFTEHATQNKPSKCYLKLDYIKKLNTDQISFIFPQTHPSITMLSPQQLPRLTKNCPLFSCHLRLQI